MDGLLFVIICVVMLYVRHLELIFTASLKSKNENIFNRYDLSVLCL